MRACDVLAELQQGLSLMCATCTHYWESKAHGISCGNPCGSPMRGDMFSYYSGQITDFSARCFVCGEAADQEVHLAGHSRVLGVCSKHVGMLTDLVPVEGHAGPVILVGSHLIPAVRVVPKKTLLQTIVETELEHSKCCK